jgi:hypothetical protein
MKPRHGVGWIVKVLPVAGLVLILRPDRLKIGKAEMICNKGRIGQARLAILSGLVGWPSRQLLVRCAKYGPYQGQG